MRPHRLLVCLLLVLLAGGCRGVQVCTNNKMMLQVAPLKDGDALRPMKVAPGCADQCNKIAIVDVDGLLVNMNMMGPSSFGENPVALFREKLNRIACDPSYRAVVLRLNSPGGGVTASDMMLRDLEAFRQQTGLPVVVCGMDLLAGGAYYLANGGDQIIAHPTTLVGGIGVILNRYNLQDTMMQVNIEATPIKSGKHTDLGTSTRMIDEEAEEILQAIADQFHQRFKDLVLEKRGPRLTAYHAQPPTVARLAAGGPPRTTSSRGAILPVTHRRVVGDEDSASDSAGDAAEDDADEKQRDAEQLPADDGHDPALFDGRIFTAVQAQKLGLIDQLGYLDDAIAVARQLAHCPQAEAVILHRPKDPAKTPYAITPNHTLTRGILPISLPGLERSRLPSFLYIWQMEPTLERWGAR